MTLSVISLGQLCLLMPRYSLLLLLCGFTNITGQTVLAVI